MAEFILKDWYGNNCTFDKDKIFVQDANGKLVEFTQGKGNPTLETLEVTENGTYTPSEGVDGFDSVTVDVPIPEVVLQDKTITENGTYTADEGFDGLGSVTVAVEGSGGGSLSAGAYWLYGDYNPPSNYRQKWFWYNGELYVISSTSSTLGDTYNLYKLVNGAWSTIISKGTIIGFGSPNTWDFVEYNGKIHMLGNESAVHYVFDGTTITKLNAVGNKVSNGSSFVQNNVLKSYSFNDGKVYVWDESTDTWSIESTIGSTWKYYTFATNNNGVYCYSLKKLYRYVDGILTELDTLSISPNNIISLNSNLYYYSTGRTKWYKYDTNTETEEFVGTGAYRDSFAEMIVIQNSLYFVHGGASYSNCCVLHEVTE